MSSPYADMRALFSARVAVFELFHRLLGGRPSCELLDAGAALAEAGVLVTFSDGEATKALAQILATWPEEGSKEKLSQLVSEHGRFMVGPGALAALPWESPYIAKEPLLFQESTLEVREAYRGQGLRARKYKTVPDDHVALMCDYLAHLGRWAQEALDGRDVEDARSLMAASFQFETEHMLNWLPEYAEKAVGDERGQLYPQVIAALLEFVDADKNLLANAVLWMEEQTIPEEMESGDGSESCRRELVKLSQFDEKLRSIELFGLEENELVTLAGVP